METHFITGNEFRSFEDLRAKLKQFQDEHNLQIHGTTKQVAKLLYEKEEVDTVIGKNHKGALVTLVDRNSKFTLIRKVDSKHATGVTQSIIELLKPIKNLIHTITSDNGKEFSFHEKIAKALDIKFYFCNPYASWERGLNEHTNGLIREYIPKKCEFDKISKKEIVNIQNRLNNRPRKVLGYKTPNEIFFKILQRKLSA